MKVGDLVVAGYKSGLYVGELLSAEGPKAKVRMLAVLKHPTQGDLHHPMQADVAMFHQRRSLAYREVANVPRFDIKPYGQTEAPDYAESLRSALHEEMAEMKRMGTPFAMRCLKELEGLERDYFAK